MDNRFIIGKILMHIGEELCNQESKLYKSFTLSNEQLEACIRLLKVASSPQTHILYIGDLAMRYGVTDRTIRNWIRDGAIPPGKKHDSGDNRDYWLSHDLHEVDKRLVSLGFVKAAAIRDIDNRLKDLLTNYKW